MHKRGITAAMLAGVTVLATAAATGDATAAPSVAPKAVPNTKPAWTAHTKSLGAAASSAKVSARVYLAPKGGMDALKSYAAGVSNTSSPDYAKFLTPAQYSARFAPTSASVKSVSAYLRSSGLKVGAVGAGNRYVTVTGTAAAAKKAFGATIAKYNRNGQSVQAPASQLTVPSDIQGSILTISGLDTTKQTKQPTSAKSNDIAPPAGFRNARPCSIYYGQIAAKYKADYKTALPQYKGQYLPYAPCGYTGPQLRAAYEGDTTLTGKGVTVAITDAYASPTMAADAKQYAKNHGDAAYGKNQYTEVLPKKFTSQDDCDASGWFGEESLDVEAVHAMAPDAKIRYYGSASCNDSDFLDALARVVDDGKAQLVSNSWGDVEANESADNIVAYEQVFLQGATEGISFLFSSGDNGDELANTGLKQADYPTSDPYVTSVGGTSVGIGADGSTLFTAGWGTEKLNLSADGKSWSSIGFTSGSGGGTSSLFNQPDYQAGVTTNAYRQVPDVSMDADPNTGMLVGNTQTFPEGVKYDEYRIGGTSLASPLFAGLTALTLQNAGHGVGLLNPVIYKNQAKFADVKKTTAAYPGDARVDFANSTDASGGLLYSIRLFGKDSSLDVTKGYDQVTGIGTPKTSWLTAVPAS